MDKLLERIQSLVKSGHVRVSEHGYDELADDGLEAREIVAGLRDGRALEEYPEYGKGPCVLVLQRDSNEAPVHVVWGIPKGADAPAVVVTAYRPDPHRWDPSFTKRK